MVGGGFCFCVMWFENNELFPLNNFCVTVFSMIDVEM